jgi:L-amino acid N-acyltransferase YncA
MFNIQFQALERQLGVQSAYCSSRRHGFGSHVRQLTTTQNLKSRVTYAFFWPLKHIHTCIHTYIHTTYIHTNKKYKLLKIQLSQAVVAHAFNPGTWEAVAGGSTE